MNFSELQPGRLSEYIDLIQDQNSKSDRLDGWFFGKEIMMEKLKELGASFSPAMTQALLLSSVAENLPLSIRKGEVFAGTEADAFARSYALINPDFKIETFEGYCDEDAVYNDITPDGAGITRERIEKVRGFWKEQPFAEKLASVYKNTGNETREVVYFVERVTGHTIPDFADAMHKGTALLKKELDDKKNTDPAHSDFYEAMKITLSAAEKIAERYAGIAAELASKENDPTRKSELQLIERTCRKVPKEAAGDLYEAIQSFIILWQTMNLDQLPNPFAFSVGNLDRMLEPFRAASPVSRELSVELVRHLLAFFCVGDRNWAISQNIMVGGMDENGKDLTNEMTYVILEAFRKSNYSQPNLSVKVHPNTPDDVYKEITSFMFEFGHSTPSFFSDPSVFEALAVKNIERKDMPLYAAAGCQEPLIMGKESANTTNSWLNLAKILELTLNDGVSMITGKKIGPSGRELGLNAEQFKSVDDVKTAFYGHFNYYLNRMVEAANGCTGALAMAPTPFHSAFMGGRESGADMRDVNSNGTKYNGSGCLIHGLGTVADSFIAMKYLFNQGDMFGFEFGQLISALRSDYKGYEDLRDFLLTRPPKFGNNDREADDETVELQKKVSSIVNSKKNSFGKNFAADWSTPSTNMLYGYWTGATPNGRLARQRLSYGIDPEVDSGKKGLLGRIASQAKLDYALMTGGSAVALSINPDPLKDKSIDDKTNYLREVIDAVFGFASPEGRSLMYAYFNVFSPKKLIDVMTHPEKYPEPVLVRIHGQYGDARHLSPDILTGDVIPRLDSMSTAF